MNLYQLEVSCIEKGPGRVRVNARTETDAKKKFWARLKKLRPGGWLNVSINEVKLIDNSN
jgi:hypothetical protein